MPSIHCFHAHVYFSEATADRARRLCEAARDGFGVAMGRMHKKRVGPHPCQMLPLDLGPFKDRQA